MLVPAVDPAQPAGLGAQQDVFLRGEMEREIQLLIDHRHALQARVVRILRHVGLAAELHRAGIGRVRAAEDFHQRALARAVFADERVHLAGRDLERHAAQSARGAEAFLDAGQPQGGPAVAVILSEAKNPVEGTTQQARSFQSGFPQSVRFS